MFNLLIGYRYHSAAVVGGEAAELVEELHGQPGTRVPHAWVVDGGKRVSTLDLLSAGFTLFTGDDGAAWCAAAASASKALAVPIAVRRIGTALDVDGSWAAATGLPPDGALLVRPDDFVAWRADKLPRSPEAGLRRALGQILGRTA